MNTMRERFDEMFWKGKDETAFWKYEKSHKKYLDFIEQELKKEREEIVEKLSEPLSQRLMNWGMTSNGKCLTAKITESHRIGKECSLSDILEEQVDLKYFLSQEVSNKLVMALK